MITHIVLFKLKDKGDVAEAERRLREMWGVVPQLRSIEVGANVVESPRAYDLSLIATFDSRDELAAYAADPFHRTVIEFFGRAAESSVTVDYES